MCIRDRAGDPSARPRNNNKLTREPHCNNVGQPEEETYEHYFALDILSTALLCGYGRVHEPHCARRLLAHIFWAIPQRNPQSALGGASPRHDIHRMDGAPHYPGDSRCHWKETSASHPWHFRHRLRVPRSRPVSYTHLTLPTSD